MADATTDPWAAAIGRIWVLSEPAQITVIDTPIFNRLYSEYWPLHWSRRWMLGTSDPATQTGEQ